MVCARFRCAEGVERTAARANVAMIHQLRVSIVSSDGSAVVETIEESGDAALTRTCAGARSVEGDEARCARPQESVVGASRVRVKASNLT